MPSMPGGGAVLGTASNPLVDDTDGDGDGEGARVTNAATSGPPLSGSKMHRAMGGTNGQDGTNVYEEDHESQDPLQQEIEEKQIMAMRVQYDEL